ncbi:hypothetical protein Ocin01_17870 [Orchesella cincta]|uniref:F-box domain-containing protein n=1 Tax=Orchesella cincta TaxID=48709 RepID=A0A1D2M761_ORCCI|nr:hypothetical protein Ocin01_17870 [Orchesella cincta]
MKHLRGQRVHFSEDPTPTENRKGEIRIAILANLLSKVKNGDTVDGVKISVTNRVFQKRAKGIYHYSCEPINDTKLVLEHLEDANNMFPSVSPGGNGFDFVDNFFKLLHEKLDNDENAKVKLPYLTLDKPSLPAPGVKMLQNNVPTGSYLSSYGFPGRQVTHKSMCLNLFQFPLLGGSYDKMYTEHIVCGSPIVSVMCPNSQGNIENLRMNLICHFGSKFFGNQNMMLLLQKERLLISPRVLDDWGMFYFYGKLLPNYSSKKIAYMVDGQCVKFSICTVLHDVITEHEDVLASPGGYLKNVFLDGNVKKNCPPDFQSPSFDVVDDGHPFGLGNPKILHSIFAHLTIPELFRVRLVNLRWNVVACEALRNKLDYTRIPPSKMKSFTKLMKKNITNPFGSYAIRIDRLYDEATRSFLLRFRSDIVKLRVRLNITELTDFARFLQKMGNLTRLHIIIFDEGLSSSSHLVLKDFYDYPNAGDETYAWKLGLFFFVKVETLILENADAAYKIHPFYDKVVANMLNACGNLKEFRFIHWNSPLGRLYSKLGIHTSGQLDTVGKCATGEDLTNLFFTTNLKFHQIGLEINPSVSFELVSDLVHKSGDILQELSVVNENIFERFALSSVLRRLLKLRLNFWSGPVDFSFFARQFPALRQLSLNLSNLFEVETNEEVEQVKTEPCLTLRTLILTRLESGVDSRLMERLTTLFPYVKELFIEVKDGSVLEKVYELYPELTLLCVELNGGQEQEDCDDLISNQNFTGVPDELVQVVHDRECGCPVVEFPEEARACWNIGCLRNLLTLILRVPNSVNNITLLEGISRLDELENLGLLPFYYEGIEPTKWCVRSIADNFRNLKTLVTSTEVAYSQNELEYLFRKLPNLAHRQKL